jgi:hypothetical protein
MCTVTFIPNGDKVFLTSSRDEIHFRSSAFPPSIFQLDSGNLIFPKDSNAGGTWICLHQNGNVVVFLNGGFIKHIPQPPYRKSRGLILLEIADTFSPIDTFSKIDLFGIEPFTAIIWENGKLFECQWDGKKSHKKQMDANFSHLWSSVTIYDPNVISKRRKWFDKWLRQNPDLSLDRIMHFHQFEVDGSHNRKAIVNKDGIVSTVSITGLELTPGRGYIRYTDLMTLQKHFEQINICKEISVRQ